MTLLLLPTLCCSSISLCQSLLLPAFTAALSPVPAAALPLRCLLLRFALLLLAAVVAARNGMPFETSRTGSLQLFRPGSGAAISSGPILCRSGTIFVNLPCTSSRPSLCEVQCMVQRLRIYSVLDADAYYCLLAGMCAHTLQRYVVWALPRYVTAEYTAQCRPCKAVKLRDCWVLPQYCRSALQSNITEGMRTWHQ
jgi:hypothetical protein